ncbi:MAG: arylamine N-acetyltransferase [Alphaproteobacteria bacterium]|nr:arylamine N-acetyltransferase [Alphaproteobacteria bacterium]
MQLQAYLDRIGFRGTARADLDTLCEVHRLHLEHIPYENLDVQFGRPVSIAIEPVFEKLVTQRRGGWCYEMNGLLSWALEEIGFKVTRMAGAVMRAVVGDANIGNHLVLRVDVDKPYLADVGFGDGLLEPVPIAEHVFQHDFLSYRLEDLGGGWWRFHNHPAGGATSFDFEEKPAERSQLVAKSEWLQTSRESPFVTNAVVQRRVRDRLAMMRGRSLKVLTPEGTSERLINSADDYVGTLKSEFELDLPQAQALWPKIVARHEELFGSKSGPAV